MGKTCTCSFSLEADGAKCSGTAKCDKKCSGTGVVEVGMYSFTLKMKKGKGAISKCKAEELITLPTQPPTGSGSPQPGSGVGSGTGGGSMGGMGSRCACVAKGMGGSTGSGSGPVPLPPTGSGSGSGPLPPTVAPTGSGSGSGAAQQKTLPWFLGMDPLELCVETGTEVVFNKTGHNVVLMATQSDYDACTGFLGENPTVG